MASLVALFRTAAWLDRGRALAWIRLLTLASMLVALALLVSTTAVDDRILEDDRSEPIS